MQALLRRCLRVCMRVRARVRPCLSVRKYATHPMRHTGSRPLRGGSGWLCQRPAQVRAHLLRSAVCTPCICTSAEAHVRGTSRCMCIHGARRLFRSLADERAVVTGQRACRMYRMMRVAHVCVRLQRSRRNRARMGHDQLQGVCCALCISFACLSLTLSIAPSRSLMVSPS